MPKSASTFISNAIANIASLERVQLVPSFGRREQELCEVCLVDNNRSNYVSQLHIRASSWTDQLCHEYNISVIVLVRSLFDVIVSLRDHAHRESPEGSIMFLERQHLNRSSVELEHLIATLAMPWYINFYMGWRSSKAGQIFMYEDFVAAPDKTVAEMLSYAGLSAMPEAISAGLAAARTGGSRINVGKAGRGAGLQPETISLVLDMLKAYPEIQDDRYIVMMREQAERILSARQANASAATASAPEIVVPPKLKLSAFDRAKRWLRRKSRLFGRKQNQVVAAGLIAFAAVYYSLFRNLIPNSMTGGRVDDFLVTAGCIFVASRLITRSKTRPVPVTPRRA
ncbi:hypothetical protein [Labrys sp. ZIDIC5]|uniref:hypothetical protein n=1 Tax=Labrys sedimenti TaxID=3106036 RepID=UPI002ACAEB25|nr:hypothetical protein [Labrys sp. ZIDIC5]MDZ5448864.1 hypothetical protein [Labrys sp. ZIDIC5]